jgi:hypothetical protein
MQKIFDQFMKERPILHRLKDGSKTQWGLMETALRLIWDNTSANSKTIETGGGLSTVAFAMRHTNHTSIFPSHHAYIQDTIADYLKGKGASPDNIHYVLGESQQVLPAWQDTGYDMVLLDGDHAFPTPFMDWFYLASKMKVGGLLLLDDTQLWPVKVLRDFLRVEPEWRLVAEPFRLAMFKLVTPWKPKWWGEQIYTVANSDLHSESKRMIPPAVKLALPYVFSEYLQ